MDSRSQPQASDGQSSFGCKTVYEGKDIEADVIFVHGLNGHQTRTWTKNGILWPRDLLPSKIPNIRVVMYGYDSTVASLSRPVSANTLFDHSKNLVSDVIGIRHGVQNRPIILVAHSLGGILCKDALEYSKQQLEISPTLCELFASTYGIIFLGTPHRGSRLSSLGVVASRVLRVTPVASSQSTLLHALKENSELLERISNAFSRMLALKEISVFSFAEELPMTGVGMVVDRESAHIGDAFEVTGSIHANHRDICRFDKSSDSMTAFERLSGSIGELVQRAKRDGQLGRLPKPSHRPLNELERQCIQGFFTSDYRTHHATVPKRHPGTCEWFFEHEAFRTWSADTKSCLLWISGNPGMGKTVLASHLVHKLQQHQQGQLLDRNFKRSRLLYYFCDNKNDEKNTALAIMRGLLHQVLLSDAAFLRQYVMPEYRSHGDKMYQSFDCLWSLLEMLHRQYPKDEITCVIDGIDECEEDDFHPDRNLFLTSMGELISSSRGTQTGALLKFIITSRPYESIRLRMTSIYNIRLRAEGEEENINSDIRVFIQAQVEILANQRGYAQELKSSVIEYLIKGSQGQFLWVALLVKILYRTPVHLVEAKLSILPSRLEDLYARLIDDMPEGVEHVLMWVVYAFRPLSILELISALNGLRTLQLFSETDAIPAMVANITLYSPLIKILAPTQLLQRLKYVNFSERPFEDNLDDSEANSFLPESTFLYNPQNADDDDHEYVDDSDEEKLLWLDQDTYNTPSFANGYKNFIEIDIDTLLELDPASQKSLTVHLVHQTVKDYFLNQWRKMNLLNSSFPLGFRNANTYLATICTSYLYEALENVSFRDAVMAIQPSDDILDYAQKYWFHHSLAGDEIDGSLWAATCALLTLPIVQFDYPRTIGWTTVSSIPIHTFVENGMLQSTCMWLQEAGTQLLDVKLHGKTVLHRAIEKRDLEIVKVLLGYGSNPSIPCDCCKTCSLHKAIIRSLVVDPGFDETRKSIIALLVQAGVDLELQDSHGETALVVATRTQDYAVCSSLLNYGADPNVVDSDGRPILHLACQLDRNHVEDTGMEPSEILLFLQKLSDHGADFNGIDRQGRTALLAAIEYCNIEVVECLLRLGSSMDVRDDCGNSAIHLAVSFPHPKGRAPLCELFVKAGLNVSARNTDGKTPIHLAAATPNNSDTIHTLCRLGVDLEAEDERGQTALLIACSDNEHESIFALLDCGADPNHSNATSEQSPLHICSGIGLTYAVVELLDRGAEVNSQDRYGWSALHFAFSSWYQKAQEIRDLLLSRGANPSLRTGSGDTAEMLLQKMKAKLANR